MAALSDARREPTDTTGDAAEGEKSSENYARRKWSCAETLFQVDDFCWQECSYLADIGIHLKSIKIQLAYEKFGGRGGKQFAIILVVEKNASKR